MVLVCYVFVRQVISKGILIEICFQVRSDIYYLKGTKKHQVDSCGYYIMFMPLDIVHQEIKGELGFVFPQVW